VYPETRRIVREQGFLSRLMAEEDGDGKPLWSENQRKQLRTLRREIEGQLAGDTAKEEKP